MAVIGASGRPGNIGGAAVRFFRKFKSPCIVYPVNRRGESVAGLSAYASVAELPSTPDLAILAIPAAAVAGAVRECADAGIRAGIAWAGGFAEGDAEGAARQKELIAICRETGFALLGPNCLGVIETHAPITASFASIMLAVDRLLPGDISMVSQSGGLATIAQALAQEQGYGFRYTISTGNEAVLGAADFLRALVDDPLTKVIALYIEGVRDGHKICRGLAAARDVRKPVHRGVGRIRGGERVPEPELELRRLGWPKRDERRHSRAKQNPEAKSRSHHRHRPFLPEFVGGLFPYAGRLSELWLAF